VLEIGCGTGRVTLPTARAVTTITGLGLSTYMLDVCRQGLQSESPAEICLEGRIRYPVSDGKKDARSAREDFCQASFRYSV